MPPSSGPNLHRVLGHGKRTYRPMGIETTEADLLDITRNTPI